MSAQLTPKPTKQEWLAQKPRLRELWLGEGKKLPVSMSIMEKEQDFHATKWEYTKHFKSEWNWSKYHKKEVWKHISFEMRKRNGEAKKSEVLINGIRQSEKRVRKEIARFPRPNAQIVPTAAYDQISSGVTIRTPVLDMAASWTLHLPFYQFENHLRLGYDPISLPSPPRFSETSTVHDQIENQDLGDWFISNQAIVPSERQIHGEIDRTGRAEGDVWTSNKSVRTALESVVPKSIDGETVHGFPLNHPQAQIFRSPLHRQSLFSASNGFTGLGSSSVPDILKYLARETSGKLYRMVVSAHGYASRAIVQNLFKAAIEAGDARVVDLLIREHPADIKINDQSCRINGERYTPLERATVLLDEALVETLLVHGATVNRTYDPNIRVGALDFAIPGHPHGQRESKIPCLPRIFRRLLEAGGDTSESSMRQFIEGDRELALLIISEYAKTKAKQWCRSGLFCEALVFFNVESCMKIIDIILEYGIGLNHDVDDVVVSYTEYSYRLIDIAAQRGMLSLVDRLLKSGALISDNTMPCAAKSQNQELILFLREKGANINSIGSLEITTISEAIRLRNDHLLNFLKDWGATLINQSRAHYSAAILAASEVGNIHYIEDMIEIGGWASPQDLGYALIVAIVEGRKETAEKLINAGADVNIDDVTYKQVNKKDKSKLRDLQIGPPLHEALKTEEESLVFLLLDTDANPNCSRGHALSTLQLAFSWGNQSVISALLGYGADVNSCNEDSSNSRKTDTPICIAIRRRDYRLIELLFSFGADINYKSESAHIRTPLEVAAEIGDVEMAQYLFDQGADPNNPQAFNKSLSESEILFNLMCETYHARCPSARGNFGVDVLVHAIKKEDHRVIERLLQNGINAGAFSRSTSIFNPDTLSTPFGHAIVGQKEEIVERFLQYGCSPNRAVFQAGWDDPQEPLISRTTAFIAAIETQNISLIKLMIQYDAEVALPARGPVKRTPLQRAAELGNLNTVNLLLNLGADVNESPANRRGGTSLHLAAIGGFIP